MHHLFKEFPQAIENTRRIADSIDLALPMGESHLPNFPIPESANTDDPDEYLRSLTNAGAKSHYGEISPEIQKRIDKAVTKGILHARTAARYKSRLTTALNKVLES